MSAPIDLRNLGRPLRVGVILLNSTTEILDVAPIDVFCSLSKEFMGSAPEVFLPSEMKTQLLDVEYHWVSESGGTMKLTSGMRLNATHSFGNCPPLDIVLMGAHDIVKDKPSEAEIAFIRKAYEQCTAFLTVCAGMMPALQAGLLEGKTATAPRPMLEDLRKQAPGVKWVAKRWANDGKIWTSGALLNGLDMMRAFMEHNLGKKVADGKALSVVDHALAIGGWPVRDVDYKDAPEGTTTA